MVNVFGGGGIFGGGKQQQQQQQQQYTPIDTATSTIKEQARRLLAISRGVCFGLPTSKPWQQSVYLNNVPVQNPDGSLNYQNFDFVYNKGALSDATMATTAYTQEPVGANLLASLPVTRTITDPSAREVTVVIGTQQFVQSTDKGDSLPTSVTHRIEISSNGGPFVNLGDFNTGSVRTQAYSWSYGFALQGSAPWSIRVTRLTPNSASPGMLANGTYFNRLETGRYLKASTAGIASAVVNIPGDLYGGSVPEFSMDWEGLQLLVPHNWPSYSGSFNGTLVPSPRICSNPAWVIWHLLQQSALNLDRYSFYSFSRWCDTLVPNGSGGARPRHTFNAYMTKAGKLQDVVASVLHSCRARLYDNGGSVVLVWDQPETLVAHCFNQSNVIDGVFSYQTSPATSRYSKAFVSYVEPSEDYEVRTVSFTQQENGYETSYSLFGCTSRAEALAHAKWSVYTSLYQTMLCSFGVGPEGSGLTPGMRIHVQDDFMLAGRALGFTQGAITLDHAVDLIGGVTYNLIVSQGQGTNNSQFTVANSGSYTSLPYNGLPVADGAWAIATPIDTTDWIITDIVGPEEDFSYSVTAVEYNASKWQQVEQISLQTGSVKFRLPQLQPPTGLIARDSRSISSSGLPMSVTSIVWGQPNGSLDGLAGYEVAYRRLATGSTWMTNTVTVNSFELNTDDPSSLQVRVRALSRQNGSSSAFSYLNFTPSSFNQPPQEITGLSIRNGATSQLMLSWDPVLDQQLLASGTVQIRYSSVLNGAVWSTATPLGLTVSGATNSVLVPKLSGTFMVLAYYSNGTPARVASSITTLGFDTGFTDIAESHDYKALSWPGVLDGCALAELGELRLIRATAFSNKGIIDNSGLWNSAPANLIDEMSGVYTAPVTDFEGLCTVNSKLRLESTASWYNQRFNGRGTVRSMGVWNGLVAPGEVAVQVRTSADNITWSDWRRFVIGEIQVHAIQVRLLLGRSFAGVDVTVQEFSVSYDLSDERRLGQIMSSAGASTTVNFAPGFHKVPQVMINVIGQSSGDIWSIDSITPNSFSFSIRNSGGNRVAKLATWQANGYGKRV
jgi:predicted phage tail protein